MTSRVVFDARRHRYSLDGKWVPSVTTIRNVMDKPGLVYAAAREVAYWAATHAGEVNQLGEQEWTKTAMGSYRAVWDKSRDAGTQLHTLAEALVYGTELPATDDQGQAWPDDIYRSAEQLARFMDTWHVDPVAHEAVVFNDQHGWAGRLDLLADMADGHRWLLDYKTGKGVYPDTSIQLAAYAHATHIQVKGEDLPMPQVERAGAVWVRPDSWQLIPVAIGDSVYEVFRSCLPIYWWNRSDDDAKVGAPLPDPEVA